MSQENCMSVMRFVWTPSTMCFCSPLSGSHTRSVASSDPEKIERLIGPHSARVILAVWPLLIVVTGQSG